VDDRVAIVTGAGSAAGIGFAVARRLHRAGSHVLITSTTDRIKDRARELDPNGETVLAWVADLTVESAPSALVAAVLERWGRIDVLVNNAGMAQTEKPADDAPMLESSYADWKRQLEITLHTAFLMTRAVLPSIGLRRPLRLRLSASRLSTRLSVVRARPTRWRRRWRFSHRPTPRTSRVSH
jgi:3-oxoacyl-[acyl-carrier protein] reductase